MRASLLTVTLGQAQRPAGEFEIDGKGTFRPGRAVTGTLVLTPKGEFPPKDPRTPMFLGSRSVSPVPVTSLGQFAVTSASALPGVRELRVTSAKAVQIDGLDGHELVGVANESTAGAALVVYEVVLREAGGGYYVLVGLGPNESAGEYLPLFQAMGATFRRK